MKHTNLFRNSEIRVPIYKDRRQLTLFRLAFLFLILMYTSTDFLIAQKILTGSGSGSCNAVFKIGQFEDVDGDGINEGQSNDPLYNDDPIIGRIQYIACPSNSNKQVAKIAFLQYEVAEFDTLTIYEGCGTTGPILSGFPYYGGGSSAANDLPDGSWYSASCESDDGCLTIVFSPNGDKKKSNGITLDMSCENRMTEVTCPNDITLPSICGLNDSDGVAALYVIPKPTATCSYDPIIMSSVMVDSAGSTVTPIFNGGGSTALTSNFEFADSDGDMLLSVGDTIYLLMGEYIFSYDYMPIPNTSPLPTCTFSVTVDEIAPVCNNQINVSLNSTSCSMILLPDMMIEGDGCNEGYTVNILEGPDKGSNILTYASVGSLVKVEVVTPFNNRCWGLVLVEDKAAPTFTCQDTAIYCGIDIHANITSFYPNDGKDCTSFTYEVITRNEISYGCGLERTGANNDPDTIGLTELAWTAIDTFGNRSAVCIQNVFKLKPKLVASNLIWPTDTILYGCFDNVAMISANLTGQPLIKVDNDTIPLQTTCLFGIEQNDFSFTTDCDGTNKFGRMWTIIDWCGSGNGPSVIQSDTQYIKVLDTIPPDLIDVPSTLQGYSEHGACSAHVIFPAISVQDNCQSATSYKVVGPFATIHHEIGSTSPDTMWNVPFGNHQFIYVGQDDCGNQSSDTITLEIKDTISPTVIVDVQSNVSLSNDPDSTWVYATSFDNGSTDNCWIDCILARRMDQPNADSTKAVGFSCDDLGDTIMVQVFVVDECGNVGINMTEVIVVDKNGVCGCIEPSISTTDTPNICSGESFDLASLNISDANLTGANLSYHSNTPAGSGNLLTSSVVSPTIPTTYYVLATNDTCTNELAVTVNVATQPNISTTSAVSICPTTSFDLSSLAVIDNNASGASISYHTASPAASGNELSSPVVVPTSSTTYYILATNGICTDEFPVTISLYDTTIIATAMPNPICPGDTTQLNVSVANGGASTIYNWTPSATLDDPAIANPIAFPTTSTNYSVEVIDENGCISRDLVPVQVNSTDVTITPSQTGTICPSESITLVATSGLSSYAWTANPDLSSSTTTNSAILMDSPGTTTTYYLTTINSFGCEMIDSITVDVYPEIMVATETLNPSPIRAGDTVRIVANISGGNTAPNYCYNWSALIPLSVGDQLIDADMQTVIFIPATSNSSYLFLVEVMDKNTTCTQINTEAVLIQSPPPIDMAALSGNIQTEQGAKVEQTTINLTGYDMPPALTGATGNYEFQEVPMYDNYIVTPEKNMNPLNGVSTFDLVLMSKHILGISTLDSPYKLIAADINRSGTITAFDMVQLRKLILNITEEFPNNTSWRFVDAAYEFQDPTNPLGEAIPETYEITDLDTDMTWLDFVAIKIGYLNNSAQPNSLIQSESRNNTGTLWLFAEPTLSTDNETLVYHFTAANFQEVLGYQFTLEYDPTILEFDRVIPTDWIAEEHFGTTHSKKGLLTTSWNTAIAKNISDDETLFSIAFTIKGGMMESDLLNINSNILQAEAYNEDEILEVHLQQELVIPEVATDKFELYQNRPNPFTGKTTIGFSLPEATTAIIRIISTDGRIIKMYEETYAQGYHELIVDSKDLTQYGALYYQLSTPTQIATKKMIYTR